LNDLKVSLAINVAESKSLWTFQHSWDEDVWSIFGYVRKVWAEEEIYCGMHLLSIYTDSERYRVCVVWWILLFSELETPGRYSSESYLLLLL
jgi:hypothetical protein